MTMITNIKQIFVFYKLIRCGFLNIYNTYTAKFLHGRVHLLFFKFSLSIFGNLNVNCNLHSGFLLFNLHELFNGFGYIIY